MNRIIIAFFLSLIFQGISAQEYTWTEDVAPIIYEHCSSCHHAGAIGPFELMNYIDVVAFSELIHHSVEERTMPPWPADPDYVHFRDEAYLEDADIEAIVEWIHNDMPYGPAAAEPDPPVFPPNGSVLDKIDLTLAIPPYELQYNTDEVRWFALANPTNETIYIKRMEVDPGLDEVVHHLDLHMDETNQSISVDAQDPLPGYNSNTAGLITTGYLNAWQPGANVLEYPDNWGFEVPPGANFVIEIHYGPLGQGLIDSSKMHLEFYTDVSDFRPMKAGWLMHHSELHLIDGPLVIPANEKPIFHQITEPMPRDLSIVAICPHMHMIGSKYRVWYESVSGDSVPMINIPHWDFHWQKYYAYPSIFKLPQGARLKSEVQYDNTLDNHDNPNNPPITVSLGPKTTDEMMLVFFIYAEYETGDETIVFEELSGQEDIQKLDWPSFYPNPGSALLQWQFDGSKETKAMLFTNEGTYTGISFAISSDGQKTLHELPDGPYYIHMKQGFDVKMISWIKQSP